MGINLKKVIIFGLVIFLTFVIIGKAFSLEKVELRRPFLGDLQYKEGDNGVWKSVLGVSPSGADGGYLGGLFQNEALPEKVKDVYEPVYFWIDASQVMEMVAGFSFCWNVIFIFVTPNYSIDWKVVGISVGLMFIAEHINDAYTHNAVDAYNHWVEQKKNSAHSFELVPILSRERIGVAYCYKF